MAIWIFGEITDASAEKACREIYETDAVNIILNSPGGVVTAAFAIHDAIAKKHCSSITVTGHCGSAALVLLPAAELCYATPNATFSFHNAASSHWETGAYIDKRIYALLSASLGSENYIEAMRRKNLNAEEAVEFGLINEVEE